MIDLEGFIIAKVDRLQDESQEFFVQTASVCMESSHLTSRAPEIRAISPFTQLRHARFVP